MEDRQKTIGGKLFFAKVQAFLINAFVKIRQFG